MNGATLLIDLGNTAAKWMRVDSTGSVLRGAASLDELCSLWAGEQPASLALVSSVASAGQELRLETALLQSGCNTWFARSRAQLGELVNSYDDSETLGVDRWLAMLAARQRCTGAFSVVDAGSALTIDIVDARGQHCGGYILPGLRLMEDALLRDTERVRFHELCTDSLAPGRSTADAVGRGLMLAQCGAVELALRMAAEELGPLPVLACGGDAPALAELLGQGVELVPELVFEGLLYQAVAEGVITAGHVSLDTAAD